MKLNFLFPSQKKIDKFPVIRIAGDENRFCAWIAEHPEIVEQIYTPGESHGTTAKKHKVTAQPIKIRKTKIKRITLTEDDTPKKEIHYNKLSWHVRGHYRHVGKDKHLVYIQPSIHTRNGKKYSLKGQKYELTED